MSRDAAAEAALFVEDLVVEVAPGERAVDSLDLRLGRGETLGLVGESGCGKTLAARAIMGLLPAGVRARATQISVRDREGATHEVLREEVGAWSGVRGRVLSMVFQDPESSLDPVFSIGSQLMEVLRKHRGLDRRAAREEARALLQRVGLADAERLLRAAPHELSGGMQQRVAIALSLAGGPAVLLADEPTTSLDVTIQRQVLALLRDLQREESLSLLLVSHDLGVVAALAHRIAVLYAGRIVEVGPTADVIARPLHPYTRALLAARPGLEDSASVPEGIRGQVPTTADRPTGCAFHPRCAFAVSECEREVPVLEAREEAAGRRVACPRVDAMESEARS